MLSVQLQPQELLDELYDLKPRAAKSFRAFVGALEEWHSNVTVAAANTDRAVTAQQLTHDQIDNLKTLLKQILPPSATEIRGRMLLTAGDLPNKEFGLRDPYDGQVYVGKIRNQALTQIGHATLMDTYDVVITEYEMKESAIGQTKLTLRLEQLIAADDSTPVPALRTPIDADVLPPW